MHFLAFPLAAFLVVICLASDESQQSVGKSLLEEAISGLDSEINHLTAQVNCASPSCHKLTRVPSYVAILNIRMKFTLLFRNPQMKMHHRSAGNMRWVMDFAMELSPRMGLAATSKPSFQTQCGEPFVSRNGVSIDSYVCMRGEGYME